MKGSAELEQACEVLLHGDAVLFPTDTVYGLGVAVEAASGPEVLYRLKKRAQEKPIAWLIASLSDLTYYSTQVSDEALVLAQAFWPGALTLIVDASNNVPSAFLPPSKTLGLRMPKSKTALSLIERVGCPLATTSANLSGEPATNQAHELSKSLVNKVTCVLEEEELAAFDSSSGMASTVVDCTQGGLRVLRSGSISAEDISRVIASK